MTTLRIKRYVVPKSVKLLLNFFTYFNDLNARFSTKMYLDIC